MLSGTDRLFAISLNEGMIRDRVMNFDVKDAAKRHFDDGEHLFAHNRFANADHLYGIAAECGLKAIMTVLDPGIVDPSGDIKQHYRSHIDVLWQEFPAFAQGRSGARYLGILDQGDPFTDWNVTQRYCHSTYITEIAVQKHQKAAKTVMSALQQAEMDGKINHVHKK